MTTAKDNLRWHAVQTRDRAAQDFVYAVTTTGIYCRAGCASRLPRRANVRFFDTPAAAEGAGFRACMRCHPGSGASEAPRLAAIRKVCRLIDQSVSPPSPRELAAVAGLSVSRFRRAFKEVVGITPAKYVQGRQRERLQAGLQRDATVTRAIHRAGYASAGRVYDQADALLGMSPTAWRKGGKGQRIAVAVGACFLGRVLVAATARGICAIELGDSKKKLISTIQARFPLADLILDAPELGESLAAVIAHINQPAAGLNLPLDIQGTAFQQRVWSALRAIEPGKTITYTDLAKQIRRPRAVRAVAAACAANKIAVAIPCHRVIRGDGSLAGYRWGLARKRKLLSCEREHQT